MSREHTCAHQQIAHFLYADDMWANRQTVIKLTLLENVRNAFIMNCLNYICAPKWHLKCARNL